MPVRSLNSPVLKWPDLGAVEAALHEWVETQTKQHPEILRVGYLGSYARGDWGVGSDLDLIIVLKDCAEPIWYRALEWDISDFPIPVELLIYTQSELQELAARGGRFYQAILQETIWVYTRQTWPKSALPGDNYPASSQRLQ